MESPPPTIQALASAYYAGCRVVLRFVEDFVKPIIDQEALIVADGKVYRHPFYFKMACGAMIQRLHAWLMSIQKLDAPADFQAILTAGRALFEMAVDLTLIKFEESGSMSKMQAWHMDAKLRWAKSKVENGLDSDGSAARFVSEVRTEVSAMVDKHWGTPELKNKRNKGRWTGRDLSVDSKKAESYASDGFVEYYLERYKAACWQVHGSGVIGTMEAPTDLFPTLAAQGLRDAERFARVACRLLLDLLGKYDDAAKAQFELMEATVSHAYADTLAMHERQPASEPSPGADPWAPARS